MKRNWIALFLALLVPATACVVARRFAERAEAWFETASPREGLQWPVTVEIPRGAGASSVARQLERAGLVNSSRGLRLLLIATRTTGRLQAGEYEFEAPLSPMDIAEMIVLGRVALHPFTLREGLDMAETAELLGSLGRWDRAELAASFRDASSVQDIDAEAGDLEGYLFPQTYKLPKSARAEDVKAALVVQFRKTWDALDAGTKAEALGLTPRQLVTLASLVEEETAIAEERPLVASVYVNRLKRGMLLQCDPTVIYGLKRDGLWPGGLVLYAHLRHDSPYNTYMHAGLPPGPICSFGEGALAAALEPASTDYLYFVATGDGGHRFAASAAEHERNVLLYRKAARRARAAP